MRPNIETDHRSNVVGCIWMIASMAGFAVEDLFLKKASVVLPVGQVLLFFGIGGMIAFGVLSAIRGDRLLNANVVSRPMIIRAGFEIFGRLFYVLAIALTALSSATAILQATPIIVVAGAAVFFGEKVGARRWGAIIVGLIGVLVILRPGTDGFSLYSVFAVLGMLGFAGRDLASRAAPADLGTSVLGFYGFLAVVVAGFGYILWDGTALVAPEFGDLALVAGAVFWGVLGYVGLMKAMRIGEVSVVTPFRYTRLLFGLSFGVVLFGETLDRATLLGCGLVVVSGIYIIMRSRHA